MVEYMERVAKGVWHHHYRIAEPAYWAALALFSCLAPFLAFGGIAFLVCLALVSLTLVGIVRWRRDRRRCRGALVVAQLREGGGTEGHADEAQRIIIESLRGKLSSDEEQLVQSVAVTVSGDEREFAAKLLRRLRGRFVLHGRLAVSGEASGWSVLPKLLEPSGGLIFHKDPFTRDITSMRPAFGPLLSSLRSERGVRDEEFPFEFCRDLEALVRGVAGRLAHAIGDEERAIALLQDAIATNPTSTSHAVDGLRATLADALIEGGRHRDALTLLRRRMQHDDPSPHLLRRFAHTVWQTGRAEQLTDKEHRQLDREVVRALRRAIEHRADPEWDMSAYNLMSWLRDDPSDTALREAEELLETLLASDSGYGKAWYVLRERGVFAWRRLLAAWEANDENTVRSAAQEAARWYGRALRARPRTRFFHPAPDGRGIVFRVRFPPSPILYANAHDAHFYAGHRLRSRWYVWRFQAVRGRFLHRAHKQFRREQWELAFANFDWAQVGRHDLLEIRARVYAAVSLYMDERVNEADATWQEALAFDPFALIVRSDIAKALFDEHDYDGPLPGDEPVAPGDVAPLFQKLTGMELTVVDGAFSMAPSDSEPHSH